MRRQSLGLVVFLVSVVYLLGAAAAWGQAGPARLVKDLNTTPTSLSGSSPDSFVAFRGLAFFNAFTLESGREVWKSDGTAAGTTLLKDIRPGNLSAGAGAFSVVDDTLYFFADDGVHGYELWKSDGTETGTVLVKDIQPGPSGSLGYVGATNFVGVGSIALFVADDGIHGAELWRTDGTENGTALVKDIQTGVYGSYPYQITEVGGIAIFSANDGPHGYDLWTSDATESGTYRIEIAPGALWTYPWIIGRAGPYVYFTADVNYGSYSVLMKTDGNGTEVVGYLGDSLDGSRGVEHEGALLFTGYGSLNDARLWKTDGTGAGTLPLVAFDVGSGGGLGELTTWNGLLFFRVSDVSTNTIGLWTTNGTLGGTAPVKTLPAGGNGGFVYFLSLTAADGGLVFRSFDSAHGFELWRSDGTEAGTTLLKDIRPGPFDGSVFGFTAVNGVVFFTANDGIHFAEPWKTDGTEAGTALVTDVNALTFTANSSPANGVDFRGELFFTASTSSGRELWKSDGTAARTTLVKDVRPGAGGSSPQALTVAGGTLFFTADDGVHGRELWQSDGTEAGTVIAKDINPGSTSSNPNLLKEAYGRLFFDANDGVHGNELWRSDGTEGGTVLVKDINPGPAPSFPLETPGDNPVLYFDADDGVHGFELWTSDGTEAGTRLVKDIVPGPGSSFSDRAFEVDGAYLFTADDDTHGRELWRTDGTEAGTYLVKDIMPGEFSSSVGLMTKFDGRLFFSAYDGSAYQQLWKSDGTEAGTRPFTNNGPDGLYIDRLIATNGTLFFRGYDLTFGGELWKTDGTESGTRLVKDIVLGPDSVGIVELFAADDTLFFAADDQVHGYELWRSDGTEAGTVLVQDIEPGESSIYPQSFALAGSRLYFSASTLLFGQELWSGRLAILAHKTDRAIEDLRGEVEALELPSAIERSLTDKLRASAHALTRHQFTAAIGLLEAFGEEVQVRSPQWISETDAASLVEFSGDITILVQDDADAYGPAPPVFRKFVPQVVKPGPLAPLEARP